MRRHDPQVTSIAPMDCVTMAGLGAQDPVSAMVIRRMANAGSLGTNTGFGTMFSLNTPMRLCSSSSFLAMLGVQSWDELVDVCKGLSPSRFCELLMELATSLPFNALVGVDTRIRFIHRYGGTEVGTGLHIPSRYIVNRMGEALHDAIGNRGYQVSHLAQTFGYTMDTTSTSTWKMLLAAGINDRETLLHAAFVYMYATREPSRNRERAYWPDANAYITPRSDSGEAGFMLSRVPCVIIDMPDGTVPCVNDIRASVDTAGGVDPQGLQLGVTALLNLFQQVAEYSPYVDNESDRPWGIHIDEISNEMLDSYDSRHQDREARARYVASWWAIVQATRVHYGTTISPAQAASLLCLQRLNAATFDRALALAKEITTWVYDGADIALNRITINSDSTLPFEGSAPPFGERNKIVTMVYVDGVALDEYWTQRAQDVVMWSTQREREQSAAQGRGDQYEPLPITWLVDALRMVGMSSEDAVPVEVFLLGSGENAWHVVFDHDHFLLPGNVNIPFNPTETVSQIMAQDASADVSAQMSNIVEHTIHDALSDEKIEEIPR